MKTCPQKTFMKLYSCSQRETAQTSISSPGHQMRSVPAGEHYSAMKRNGLLKPAVHWTGLKIPW